MKTITTTETIGNKVITTTKTIETKTNGDIVTTVTNNTTDVPDITDKILPDNPDQLTRNQRLTMLVGSVIIGIIVLCVNTYIAVRPVKTRTSVNTVEISQREKIAKHLETLRIEKAKKFDTYCATVKRRLNSTATRDRLIAANIATAARRKETNQRNQNNYNKARDRYNQQVKQNQQIGQNRYDAVKRNISKTRYKPKTRRKHQTVNNQNNQNNRINPTPRPVNRDRWYLDRWYLDRF